MLEYHQSTSPKLLPTAELPHAKQLIKSEDNSSALPALPALGQVLLFLILNSLMKQSTSSLTVKQQEIPIPVCVLLFCQML